MPQETSTPTGAKSWVEEEMEGCQFCDQRLAKRAIKLIEQMAARVGASVPGACQDWASTKAAYRFFDNESVNEEEILRGHLQATKERIAAVDERVLILHEFNERS